MKYNISFPDDLKVPQVKNFGELLVYPISAKSRIYLSYHSLIRSESGRVSRHLEREYHFAGMGKTPNEARFTCFMEMVERMNSTSWENIVERTFFQDTEKLHKIPWVVLAPYDSHQMNLIRKATKERISYWMKGFGVISKKKYVVPAEAVISGWDEYIGWRGVSPEYDGSGLAAGFLRYKKAVIRRAIREVIERDSVLLSWRIGSWPCLRLNNNLLEHRYEELLKRRSLKVEFYDVGDPRLEPVILALIHRADGTELTCGASCHFNKKKACVKAFSEAIMLRYTARGKLKERGGSPIHVPVTGYDHVVYGYCHGPQVLRWYQSLADQWANKGLDYSKRKRTKGKSIEKKCKNVFGAEPVFVNLTNKFARRSKLYVCRVLIPNAYRMEISHRKPMFGGRRLLFHLGNPNNLHRLPHPFG